MEGHQLDLSGSGQRQVVGCCEHGKKPSASTQYRVFLDKQRTISISREALLHGVGQFIFLQHLYFAYRNITFLLTKPVTPFIHICYPTSLKPVHNHKHACMFPCNRLQTLQVYFYAYTDCFKWFLLPPVSDILIQYGLVNCIRCMHFLQTEWKSFLLIHKQETLITITFSFQKHVSVHTHNVCNFVMNSKPESYSNKFYI